MKTKDEVFQKFKYYKALVEKQTGHEILVLRSDRGGEYMSDEFRQFLKENGIEHQLTVRDTPEQNGVAERANLTLMEKVRAMLKEAGLPLKFWGEGLHTAVFLKNMSPTVAVPNMVPFEAWTSRKPNVSNLKIFGCTAYVHVPKVISKKLGDRAKALVFVGYDESSKGYKLIDLKYPQKIITERNVTFDENSFPALLSNIPIAPAPTISSSQVESVIRISKNSESQSEGSNSETYTSTEISRFSDDIVTDSSSNVESDISVGREDLSEDENRRYPTRDRKPKQFPNHVAYLVETGNMDEPLDREEALSSKNKTKWVSAMDEEIRALNENDVWELVERPAKKNVVSCKWVYKIKKGLQGEADRYRARLVARGFSQQYGLDYFETFSPVVRTESLRLLISLAVKKNLSISHLDVCTAFLNGVLEEDVYMEQPAGYVSKDSLNKVFKLKKALYGLKQASRAWNSRLNDVLISLNYVRSLCDPCLYIKRENNCATYIGVHVDDIFIFSNDSLEESNVKSKLLSNFECRDLGALKHFLGVTVETTDDKVVLNQTMYLDKVISKFNGNDSVTYKTPMENGLYLTKNGAGAGANGREVGEKASQI
jgi:hypothetical protein